MKRTLRKLLARCISRLPKGALIDDEVFDIYERRGLHITPVHFYEPIPDTSELRGRDIWDQPSQLPGIELDIEPQVELLEEFGRKWLPEYNALLTSDPHWATAFGGLDGGILYSMVREHQPNLVMEIGSGGSTLITAEALRRNGRGRLTAIDPCPRIAIKDGLDGIGELVEQRVETVPLSAFEQLGAKDILFIDSSHTVRIGGDVIHEICEILPRLAPGVLVHLHDIYLPLHYPREWVLERRAFWAEQYMLQAFLAHNSAWRILWSAGSMHLSKPREIQTLFPHYDPTRYADAGSFWMVREH